jgi:hypothetical protein
LQFHDDTDVALSWRAVMKEMPVRRRSRILRVGLLVWLAALLVVTRPWSAPAERDAQTPATCANPGALDASLFLVGDAGAPRAPREPLLDVVAAAAGARVRALGPDRVTVVFLGDNVYPAGLRASDHAGRAEDERRLDAQLDAVRRSGARGIVVPGNHDWANGGSDGWDAVKRETRFVAARGAVVLPPDGCPGPAAAPLGAHLQLIFLDTQWWLQRGARPSDADSGCAQTSEGEVERALAASLQAAGDRHAIVLAHHPLRSGGPHGGVYGWQEHLFPLREFQRSLWIPLPVIGSIRPILRALGVDAQDIPSAANGRMRASIQRGFGAAMPLLFAAGHDHSLQLLRGGDGARFHAVSGAGSEANLTWAHPIEGTLFADAQPGWMRLDGHASGAVELTVEAVTKDGSARALYSACLASP